MELSVALRAVIATMRKRPSDLFPFYLLGFAVPAIAQVLTIIGVAIVAIYLVGTSRFAQFQEQIATLEEPPDPAEDPDAFMAWSEQLQAAVEPLLSLPAIILLLGTIGLAVVLSFLLVSVMHAGQLSTCFARLRGERGTMAGIAGIRQYWLRLVGLRVFEILLWITVTVGVVTLIAAMAMVSVVLAIFVAIFAGLGWLIAAVIIRAIFVFAPVAVIVDDQTVLGSVFASAGFIRHEFAAAVSYYAIAIGIFAVFSGMSATFALIGAPALTYLGMFLLITPALDLFKTALYGDYRGLVKPVTPPQIGISTQLKRGIRRSLSDTAAFVRETPWYLFVSFAVMVVGFGLGWLAAEPLVGEFEMAISGRIATLFGPTAPLYFFSNNWLVAISIAFAGVAGTIPTLVILFLNGFVSAFAVRLEVEPLELAAFVLPHGVIEIPAILISGALGIYLGVSVWRTWRHRSDRKTLADTLERSFWIIIGIGILLAIAGLIEGYVSPYYWRPFL